jgi:hypothetical protein
MTVALAQAAAAPTAWAAAQRTNTQARHADAGAQLAATSLAASHSAAVPAARARTQCRRRHALSWQHAAPRMCRRSVDAATAAASCWQHWLAARSLAQPATLLQVNAQQHAKQPCRRKRRSGASASAVPLRSGAPRAARPPRLPGTPLRQRRSGCCVRLTAGASGAAATALPTSSRRGCTSPSCMRSKRAASTYASRYHACGCRRGKRAQEAVSAYEGGVAERARLLPTCGSAHTCQSTATRSAAPGAARLSTFAFRQSAVPAARRAAAPHSLRGVHGVRAKHVHGSLQASGTGFRRQRRSACAAPWRRKRSPTESPPRCPRPAGATAPPPAARLRSVQSAGNAST